VDKEKGKPEEVDFGLFWDTWEELEKNFANKEKIDKQEMVYGAIAGMVESLGDPYTIFMDPEETEMFTTDISGSFEGVGMEVGVRDGIPTVIAPLSGTPAEKAGIKPGDKILKVDDNATMDLTLDEVVNLIRGPKGTEVSLTIIRDALAEPLVIKIKRDNIKIPNLEWKIEDEIAIISFYQFSSNAGRDFKKAINECMRKNIKGLIIDLRNNPGGYLEVSVEIAEQFVDKGKIIVTEEYADGTKQHQYARGKSILKDFPAVILINEGSASASEIVAGALRDHNGIKLVGKKTYGKGSVQELKKMKSGSSLKITVAKWLTPFGECINENGIEPDIEVEMTYEDFEQGKDPQMDKAKEVLKNEF